MKTTTKTKARAQKARVMWSHRMYSDGTIQCHPAMDGYSHREPVVVLPLLLPQAKKLRDFANLSEEERVVAVAKAIWKHGGCKRSWRNLHQSNKGRLYVLARAILSAIGL